MKTLLTSLRVVVVTMAVCVVGYTSVVLGVARIVSPRTAGGSLIVKNGKIVGSELIAQKFSQPGYFWPRPSAADYNAAASVGSNLSPTNPRLTERARALIAQHGATSDKPLPTELVAASGSGLDPHISERAALYQVERVANARGLPESDIVVLIRQRINGDGLVNVLLLNLALDDRAETVLHHTPGTVLVVPPLTE